MAYLIKGAHLVDPQVALDEVADVLIEGTKISKVAQNIEDTDDVVARLKELTGKRF